MFPARNLLRVFATCPQSKDHSPADYRRRVVDVARWSEQAGCEGILVYTDNSICDPWLVAQALIAATERIVPLVAVQPVYMHPYTVAKLVTSLAYLHGRKVALNMLAGGFRGDLLALGDDTEHDLRYQRTAEYTRIVMALLRGEKVTFEGRWWTVRQLALEPPLPPELMPEVLVSGSSPAGLRTAAELGATPVRYPRPPGEESDLRGGVRVGIVARPSAEEAWSVARDRFPGDRKGQLLHRLAMQISDSHWHRQLASREHAAPAPYAAATPDAPATPGTAGQQAEEPNPYWLWPFQNYKTFCPYLVGSYERVGRELAAYVKQGADLFILDIPPTREELEHVRQAFALAAAELAAVGR